MDILFKGTKTGAEIWEIIKHKDLEESQLIPDRLYKFTLYNKQTEVGVKFSEMQLIPTEEEIKQQKYETEKTKTIEDVKLLRDKMIILEATQSDIDNRLAEWQQWKVDNGYSK